MSGFLGTADTTRGGRRDNREFPHDGGQDMADASTDHGDRGAAPHRVQHRRAGRAHVGAVRWAGLPTPAPGGPGPAALRLLRSAGDAVATRSWRSLVEPAHPRPP